MSQIILRKLNLNYSLQRAICKVAHISTEPEDDFPLYGDNGRDSHDMNGFQAVAGRALSTPFSTKRNGVCAVRPSALNFFYVKYFPTVQNAVDEISCIVHFTSMDELNKYLRNNHYLRFKLDIVKDVVLRQVT